LDLIWRAICSYPVAEAGGEDQGVSLELWLLQSPPQAVESKKIIGALIRGKNDLLSAGNGLAKKGNTLGHLMHRA
jgi:hypothetical protein